MANFEINQLGIIADIFIKVMNYHCVKFYTNASTNMNTTKIFQFLAIIEQNFTVLPQNIRFWTYSAWHHS